MTFQRTIQVISLMLFFLLLAGAAFRFTGWLPHDLFLRLDPAAAFLTGISARIWLGGFFAAMAVLTVTFVLGRFFCGYLCPLGTTIDGAFAPYLRAPENASVRHLQRTVVVGGKRLTGHQVHHHGHRGRQGAGQSYYDPFQTLGFFALIILPLLQQLTDLLLQLAAPLADWLNLPGLVYLQLPLPRFDRQWLTFILMLVILAGGRWMPRFWCRCV